MNHDRLDMEQYIMDCWKVTDEIKLFTEALIDGSPPLTEDEQANVLIGLRSLYELKFNRLWNQFEKMTRDGTIK